MTEEISALPWIAAGSPIGMPIRQRSQDAAVPRSSVMCWYSTPTMKPGNQAYSMTAADGPAVHEVVRLGRCRAAGRVAGADGAKLGIATGPTTFDEDHVAVPAIAEAGLDHQQPVDLHRKAVSRSRRADGRRIKADADVGRLEAEHPVTHLQVAAAHDAACKTAGRKLRGTAGRSELGEILRPPDVAPNAAELAADVEAAPIADVLGIRIGRAGHPSTRLAGLPPFGMSRRRESYRSSCDDQQRHAMRCARVVHNVPHRIVSALMHFYGKSRISHTAWRPQLPILHRQS